jgi:hypothetical protein
MSEPRSGKIDQVFTEEEIINFQRYMSALPEPLTLYDGNRFSSIGQKHIMYSWFCKKVFNRIQELVGTQVQLLFGSYLNEVKPLSVHSDYYHKSIGEPYRAFLIPISANHNIHQVDMTNTVIFNEEDTFVDDNDTKTYNSSAWLQTKTFKNNNALMTHPQELSHIPNDILECLTVQNVLNWTSGSVLWWDERLLHVSDNFVLNGVQSKQAIVVHTYVV